MNKAQKKQFVKELTHQVVRNITKAIEGGRIPEDWDGVELRELLYEKFLSSRYNHLLDGSRGREYRNTVIVNNL